MLAVLAPGYGGGPEQRFLQSLAARLAAAEMASQAVQFSIQGKRPSTAYATEMDDLRRVRDTVIERASGRITLIGRSFGADVHLLGRPGALVVSGYPIAPPGRPRPHDEAALLALRCPTLIIQGDHEELGPLAVLEAIAAKNLRITIAVIKGAKHAHGRHEREAVDAVAAWLAKV